MTTQWCISSIAKSSELQTNMKQQIENDPNDMETPLVKGVLREVLRLYPVAPFIGRIFEQDATIGGHFIPKYTMALLSLYSSGREPENFPDPLKFMPERWSRSGGAGLENVCKAHGSMPFAIGARSCVGKKAATYQIHCLLTKVRFLAASEFDFKYLID